MKRFRTISTAFIIVIALIFCCNVYYLVTLYSSIRATVEKDVMAAIAAADLDELWNRAEHAHSEVGERMMADQAERQPNVGEMSAGIDGSGMLVAQSSVNGEAVASQTLQVDQSESFNDLFSQTIGRQFHAIIDRYVPVDPAVMDSVLTLRLANRFIYPDFVATEVVDSLGTVVIENDKFTGRSSDEFSYCFNPADGLSYRVRITPLTRHIFAEMAGVIVTVLLLMIAFALAFSYLLRTVGRLRTIEEMKDDFVNNMTHELKTPIAIAYSANDALLNYDTANNQAKKEAYLRIANKQLKRLGELVESILAMSMERRKNMQLRIERIALLPFVDEIASAQRMRTDKPINIAVDIAPDVSVEADPTHLANVLNNLIDNAIKYSGESVDITIRCADGALSVADNGIGIPAAAIPYLFNKFYRVPRGDRQDARGYGIGLYYAKSIADKMGWTLSVKSREGVGSVFTINFSNNER